MVYLEAEGVNMQMPDVRHGENGTTRDLLPESRCKVPCGGGSHFGIAGYDYREPYRYLKLTIGLITSLIRY
jgi:hypothetical protein